MLAERNETMSVVFGEQSRQALASMLVAKELEEGEKKVSNYIYVCMYLSVYLSIPIYFS